MLALESNSRPKIGKNGLKKFLLRNIFSNFINQHKHACKCRLGSKLYENEEILEIYKARKKKIQLEVGPKWPFSRT